jgi:NAD(P)-dependent dehydrogenase (short-subunit alcohol dehydrogenase family)
MTSTRPAAIVANARFYVGPDLCRHLARRGFDIVAGDAKPDLVKEIESLGVECTSVEGGSRIEEPTANRALVERALDRHGRIDSAVMFSGDIITGSFMKASLADLHKVVNGCLEAPFHFMQAVLPTMIEAGAGQILVMTSAAGVRPVPGVPLYSAVRAGATMLVKNVAEEVAPHGVQVNAVGTNNMDFPAFLKASGATDPAIRARIEARVPLRRLGTLDECAAFCMAFLDGTSRFATGQFVAYAGGLP